MTRRIVPLLVGLLILLLAFAVSTLATRLVWVQDRAYALEEVCLLPTKTTRRLARVTVA